jgi:hypothetical protein
METESRITFACRCRISRPSNRWCFKISGTRLSKQGATTLVATPCFYSGAGGENRTRTPLRAEDFESSASTSSTTPASLLVHLEKSMVSWGGSLRRSSSFFCFPHRQPRLTCSKNAGKKISTHRRGSKLKYFRQLPPANFSFPQHHGRTGGDIHYSGSDAGFQLTGIQYTVNFFDKGFRQIRNPVDSRHAR